MARTTQITSVTTPRKPAASKRTTAPKPRGHKVDVDIDAMLAEEIEDDDSEVPTKTIRLLGQEFEVKCRVNEYLLNAALGNDLEALNKFYETLMSPADFRRFRNAMAEHPNMNTERFSKIFVKMLEVVSERPTN